MKRTSLPAIISIYLLATVIGIVFITPANAQDQVNRLKSSKALAAVQSNNPRIKAGVIDEKIAEAAVPENSMAVDNRTGSPKDADYWFAKAALCATYGNDRAAVKYYRKAVSLDVNRSDAYFGQGVSYGQLGDFDKAVTLVNKAIEMEPQNGMYLYGRGRIYLLNGQQDQAMEDIKKAAELNDEDAQDYLKYVDKK